MDALLDQGALFDGLDSDGRRRLSAIVRRRTLQPGEYLFLLGDDAGDFYVVVTGTVELCLPIRFRGVLKDVSVESVGAGQPLGWSALVRPYRFTLSARAREASEVACLARRDLQELFSADPGTGYGFFTKISEVIGIRLLTFQALWLRELQRAIEQEQRPTTERVDTSQELPWSPTTS